MRINFVLPFKIRKPAGGFRVMYEYANRLADLGYDVHITYPIKAKYVRYRLPFGLRVLMSYIEKYRPFSWFTFNPNITMSYVKSISNKNVIDADIIIATWWSIAVEVSELSKSKGEIINLIQGYEDWLGHVDELHASYNLTNTYNVVVAKYLKDIVAKYTKKDIVYIPNAIDTNVFRLEKTIEERNPYNICMLYSTQEIKGSVYGLEALHKLHNKYPDIRVDLFGICPEPDNLPDWITYHYNSPNLSKIYNNNAIFISNSFTEGFPLVVLEAMACGCALVCTDIKGHRESAVDHETALLVELKNPEDVVLKVSSLIEDKSLLQSIAKNGNQLVKQYSWDVSAKKMNSLIEDILNKRTI